MYKTAEVVQFQCVFEDRVYLQKCPLTFIYVLVKQICTIISDWTS